ncbi:hypothetical protein VUR80DRAFT_7769 [Thermomyces stellatus]
MTSSPPGYRSGTPPPPYESRPGSLHEHRSPPPSFEDYLETIQGFGTTQQLEEDDTPSTAQNESTDTRPDEPAAEKESRTKGRLSFIHNAAQAYKDKRRAKEATRKVNYYQKLYGFVPKNAMTEAEWRDAREKVPKTKVPFRPRSRGMTALGLSGSMGSG